MLKDKWQGFLPNVHDTKILANYVDENSSVGLKHLSDRYLNYKQVSYAEVTSGRKMDELTLNDVLSYGADDSICTAALYRHFKLITEMEGTFEIYKSVEVSPSYLTAQAFIEGVDISLERMRQLEEDDDKAFEAAWVSLELLLIDKGWEGSVYTPYTGDAASIKYAYNLVTGNTLDTQVRTASKLFALIRDAGDADTLVSLLESEKGIDDYLKLFFKGKPVFSMNSPKQLQTLLYEVLCLPIRLRNPVTDAARLKGAREGSPKTDDLAMEFALKYDEDLGVSDVIKNLQTLKTITTRRGLYYGPYKVACHWSDSKIHAQFNQSSTNTRRYSSSSPNLQQLAKAGDGKKFREIFIPHKSEAVIVSLDFSGQELRLLSEASQDANMLACYVGDDLRDLHSLTAVGIAVKQGWDVSYEDFIKSLASPDKTVANKSKGLRDLGKKVNFTTAYGCQAKKLSETLMVTEVEAQQYIDAKVKTFPRDEEWKKEIIDLAKVTGLSKTMLGAKRHLGPALLSRDKFEASKAARQSVNFFIQGSAAEMTKLALARMWDTQLFNRFDAKFIATIHDEVVASVVADQAYEFICDLHSCMIQPYATMQVPIIASISLGPNFGVQIECGEIPDREIIEEALRSLGFLKGSI